MQIGIFETVFSAPTLAGRLDQVVAHGIRYLQFDLGSAGIADPTRDLTESCCCEIQRDLSARGIAMSAVSGTFNMAHPDPAHRRKGLAGFKAIAEHCKFLGTSVITICTGTRNLESMWHPHPENGSAQAWADLRSTAEEALRIAEDCNVVLGLEPEVSNVIDSPKRARRLIDELKSKRLKIVMDGANIFHLGELPRMHAILDEAFDLLGSDIVLAHAKDLDRDGAAGHLAAGEGKLDYAHYIAGFKKVKFDGPIILHGLTQAQAPTCIKFLRRTIAQQ
jgi:sugar phosphate isomerase/epimerase